MIRIGIIGTGHGVRTLKPGFEYTQAARVVALAGSSIERARQVASENDIEIACGSAVELCALPSLDLICVASPNRFHVEHAITAIQSGKHVYLEKPIGNSRNQALQIQEALNNSAQDRLVFVGHQLRFNPFIREIVRLIDKGDLGRIYSVAISQRGGAFASDTRPWTWEFEAESGGGVRLAMATHLLDLANYIARSTPKYLTLSADPVHQRRRPNNGEERIVEVSNFCSLDVDYGETFAQLSTSAAAHLPGYFRIEVLGNRGAVTYDGTESLRIFRDNSIIDAPQLEAVSTDYLSRPGASVFRKSFTYFAEEIIRAISGSVSSVEGSHSVQDAVDLMSLLDSSYAEFQSRFTPKREAF